MFDNKNDRKKVSDEVAKGIIQAKVYEESFNVVIGGSFIVAVIFGIFFHKAWVSLVYFFGSMMILAMAAETSFPPLKWIFCVILGLFWGFTGWIIGHWFNSTTASEVLAIIGFLGGLANYSYAIDYWRYLP